MNIEDVLEKHADITNKYIAAVDLYVTQSERLNIAIEALIDISGQNKSAPPELLARDAMQRIQGVK